MKFINRAFICLFTIMICSLQGCYWDNEERLYVQPPIECDTSALPSYSSVVLPILKTSCYSCHNSKNYAAAGDNINLEGYEKLKRWITDGSLLGSINHDKKYFKMPKGTSKLSDCKIQSIKKWIDEGALNN